MAEKTVKQRGLGRGLSALMADVTETTAAPADSPRQPDRVVPIERVVPNPDQPRRQFDKDQMEDLAASIREKGIIQPLIVRQNPRSAGEFEIVAGERRWRAAQIAKLHEIPVLVRDFTDAEVLEVAIIENIQRADLNAMEEAVGFRQLMEKFGHTQEKLSEALGKSRSHVANSMRLLQLPIDVQSYVRDGKLSAGHARALITADDPVALAKQVIARGLSVRETEELAKKGLSTGAAKPVKLKTVQKDADTKALEGDLSASLGMKVMINHKPGQESGQIVIGYKTLDELDSICRILSASN